MSLVRRTPALHELGDLQLRILGILWEAGEASVKEIQARWEGDPAAYPAYVTLLTVCRRLEKRGLLSHREQQRAGAKSCFIYKAEVRREALQEAATSELARRLFDSPRELMICAARLASRRDGVIARECAYAAAGGCACGTEADRGVSEL